MFYPKMFGFDPDYILGVKGIWPLFPKIPVGVIFLFITFVGVFGFLLPNPPDFLVSPLFKLAIEPSYLSSGFAVYPKVFR